MSTSLGHPDLLHFPPPPPTPPHPPTTPLHSHKVKTPSQHRREERRNHERINETETNDDATVEIDVQTDKHVNNTQTTGTKNKTKQPDHEESKQLGNKSPKTYFKYEKCQFLSKNNSDMSEHMRE